MPPPNNPISQHDLLLGCLRNDRKAQELFYKLHYNTLLAICRNFTTSEEDANAILQESFLKIFQHLDVLYVSKHSLQSWMHQIVVWTATEYLGEDSQKA